jgi:hypothetical protein
MAGSISSGTPGGANARWGKGPEVGYLDFSFFDPAGVARV